MKVDIKTKGRAWIATVQIKNFTNMGLTEEQYTNHEYLADYLINLWEQSGTKRSAAVAICESKNELYHAHMALYGNTTTLKHVADILCGSHVEPQLGGKQALTDYLLKKGKHAQKEEAVLFTSGLENIQDVARKKNIYDEIEEDIALGKTPKQILGKGIRFYPHEKTIRSAYRDMRIKKAPLYRKPYVEYHFGDSGTGKTYTYNLLCKEYGADAVYLLTDFDNNASGGLDEYMSQGAPPILFIDEFKGRGISYEKLLTMLNGYSNAQIHSRYANTYALWEKVYITSIYPLENLYQILLGNDDPAIDTYEQLRRRIDKIVYHFKNGDEYLSFSVDSSKYRDCTCLKYAALKEHNIQFTDLTEEDKKYLPFHAENNVVNFDPNGKQNRKESV